MLQRMRQDWNRFWFEPQSPASLALFRILYGLLLLINGLMLYPNLLEILGNHGMLSRQVAHLLAGDPVLGPWKIHRIQLMDLLPRGDHWVVAFFAAHLLAALCLTLGCCTRLSAVAVFLTLVSLQHRNTMVLHSGDSFLRVVSFFLVFSPAGAMYSVDSWWRTRRDKNRGQAGALLYAPWAQRLIQFQFSIVYLAGVVWKLQGFYWLNGTAVYYTSRLEEFRRFPVPYLFEHMWTLKLLTWGSLFVEFLMATAIWMPEFRYYVLAIGVLFHLGLEYSMNIPLFEITMIAALVTFVEPQYVENAVAWLRERMRWPARAEKLREQSAT